MNIRLAALRTSWIAIVGTILLTWLGVDLWLLGRVITGADDNPGLAKILQVGFLFVPVSLVAYGFYIWMMLSLSILVIDLFLFRPSDGSMSSERIRIFLLIEWGVISVAVICWAAVTSSWLLTAPIVPLLLAQGFRGRRMERRMRDEG